MAAGSPSVLAGAVVAPAGTVEGLLANPAGYLLQLLVTTGNNNFTLTGPLQLAVSDVAVVTWCIVQLFHPPTYAHTCL